MTWTKLSDDFADDSDELSDAAFRLHVEGLVRSNRKLLDCLIPKAKMPKWATHPEAVAELLACGFWTDEGDHYRIRHHASYQRTREQVIRLQERNQRNGKAGGRPRKAPREVWETQVGSEMGAQMETQRDRSGQDRPGREGVPEVTANECTWCDGSGCPQCDEDLAEAMGA